MMTSSSPAKIDAVEIGEIHIDFFTAQVAGKESGVMAAKYALVVSSEGTRMGSGNRNVWSEGTLQKLQELVKAMENDICLGVFGDAHTSGGADPAPSDTSDSVPSL